MAAGTRVLFDLHRCTGPLTLKVGVREAVEAAVKKSGVTVVDSRFTRFPDDTINFTADLAESHCGLGVHLVDRFVSGEVNMCNETRNNRDLANFLVECFREVFKPEESDITEFLYESR